MSQLEEIDDYRAVAAGGRQFAQVDEVDQCPHCLLAGLLDDQLPSGLFSGLRVEHGLKVDRRFFQDTTVHLKSPSHNFSHTDSSTIIKSSMRMQSYCL